VSPVHAHGRRGQRAPSTRPPLARVDKGRLAECAGAIERDLESAGYELVDLVIGKAEGRLLIELIIDREAGVTQEDCARAHETVNHWFDAVDPVGGPYMLQVSSPGLDRPLRKPHHFRRFAGRPVKMRVRLPEGGSRRLQGKLLGLADDDRVHVLVEPAGVSEEFAIEDIAEARLRFDWDDLVIRSGPAEGDEAT